MQHACEHAKSLQSCPTLLNPVDCSPPGFSVHGILHVPMPSSKGSSRSRDRIHVSCSSRIAGSLFTAEPWGSPQQKHSIPSSIWSSDKQWVTSKNGFGIAWSVPCNTRNILIWKNYLLFLNFKFNSVSYYHLLNLATLPVAELGKGPSRVAWDLGLLGPSSGSQLLGDGALPILLYGMSWSSKPSHGVALRVRKGRSGWWAMAPRGTAVANTGPSWVSPGGSLVTKSCLTLCDLKDCSLPGSSLHWIFQARMLEWVAISFSRGSSQPRDRTCIAGKLFTTEPPGKAITSLY